MKQLICVADIQQLIDDQKNTCHIPMETIITAAAMDLAVESGIRFIKQEKNKLASGDISMIMARLCSDQELLQQMINVLSRQEPFKSQEDSSGFQLIDGDSICFEPSDSKQGIAKQTLFANFNQLKVEIVDLNKGVVDSSFSEEAIYFVLEGELVTTINQKQFESKKGDIHYFPPQLERKIVIKEATQLLVIKKISID
ncbi:hypothetical protein I6N95_11615 [Vagococcus sp. BWB3-3]|uniref:Cupin domain-containing protein n=1 Tax=Vagococcus allomyrinae TaxID=2794353 RepID=A0A940SUU0_9ENTE|nr:hypothetical protein [Vagococcus allomyrinae]MBP1041655.1 hypothetical protein [Vagococcus allomyrinae]